MAEHLAPLIDNQSRVVLSENSAEMAAVVLFALLGLSKEVLLLNRHLTLNTNWLTKSRNSRLRQSSHRIHWQKKIADSISFSEIWTSNPCPVSLSADFPDEKIAVIMNTSATTGKFKSVPYYLGHDFKSRQSLKGNALALMTMIIGLSSYPCFMSLDFPLLCVLFI